MPFSNQKVSTILCERWPLKLPEKARYEAREELKGFSYSYSSPWILGSMINNAVKRSMATTAYNSIYT